MTERMQQQLRRPASVSHCARHAVNLPYVHTTPGTFSSSILSPTRPAGRGALVVVAGGNSMGNTLHGSKRKRRRTSGFRTRMQVRGSCA
jgi:hypothetical protein